ncbi:hypothetical protein ISF_05358 [Cordyceps fumosorosea ARSEF 2679]|uniref:Uncharacterized protein n=1 Tax=Cordyceps fumosorosea (strain ARSEF 2679) TaxID=1081104 RepID=A0A167V8R2_CORFA|nr:hypothetical protein ISF_05358 [Cordyceps fumosorosea ARSEF 2679]OAA62349.1 hypothetical protein ISF_05358 [Cordyceps fumosorosea ARSEF 2679]
MGRKPNPLILEYFVRGAKLNDNSNRYQHTCKRCGENFPKGRIDSLTTHITKKCPAISDSDRMRACLELHGLTSARAAAAERLNNGSGPRGARPAASSVLPQEWSALETLAEASRQVDLNENNRVPPKGQEAPGSADPAFVNARFELQEQFTLDNPPAGYEDRGNAVANGKRTTNEAEAEAEPDQANASKIDFSLDAPQVSPTGVEMSAEERLQALLPATDSSPDASNISVAVAAAARLNPSFLDPQLVDSEPSSSTPSAPEANNIIDVTSPVANDATAAQPWGEMTYLAATAAVPLLAEHQTPPAPLNRGGIRMDTSDASILGRPRHSRSRFTPARRKEVQEVRKIGACIRCRILRKNCGKGNPCDTCRKVLAPRVWRTGCVRTRLHEQLDLYSAGVQVVLSQNRINLLKEQLQLTNNGSVIEVSHFPEAEKRIVLGTMETLLEPNESQAEARNSTDPFRQAIMIDQDTEDIPSKIELYMRDVLPLFIEREPSKFTRITLETALEQQALEEDELLSKALELWGLVESIDRERQWTILERPAEQDAEARWISEAQHENDADIYTMICMQLNAAAERKANSTSKALLNHMDRLLTDSKTRVGFRMFLTALVFLNCVEKSTWAFKAWEQDHLRGGWPLERDPSVFAQQGGNLAGLLKMLLAIRKALPQTRRDENGKLAAAQNSDPAVTAYFEKLDLECKASPKLPVLLEPSKLGKMVLY